MKFNLREMRACAGIALERDIYFSGTCNTFHHVGAHMLSYAMNGAYVRRASENSSISVLLVAKGGGLPEVRSGLLLVACEQPDRIFFAIHNEIAGAMRSRFDFKSVVNPSSRISKAAHISEVGVVICEDVAVEAGAVILPGAKIGAGSIIRSGVVIGAEGFEFKRHGEAVFPVIHHGGVELEENVEVQSNSTIANAVFSHNTHVGKYSKMDCGVHIAHGARIGRRTLIAARAVVAGSSRIGDDVWVGPGAVISNEISIGDRCKVNIGAVVVRDLPAGSSVSGNWAIDHSMHVRRFMGNK